MTDLTFLAKALVAGIASVSCFVGATPLPSPSPSPPIRPPHRVVAFFGDSASSAVYTPPGFPALVAKFTGLSVRNLATVSAVRNRATYSTSQALSEQLPRLPAETTDAVVFLGIDDLQGLAKSGGPLISGSFQLSDLQKSYLAILHALEARHIAIHIITVRNFSLDPKFANPPASHVAEWKSNMERKTNEFDDWLVSLDYPTLDIRTVPELMDNASYVDGIHFSKLGLQRVARRVSQWLNAPAPTSPRISGKPRIISFIGDTLSSPVYSPPGFPALVGLTLDVPVHNLALPNSYIAQGLEVQLPKVPADTTDAVVFLGIEDLRGFAIGQESLPEAEKQYAAMVAGLKAKGITVHLVAPRDYSLDPGVANPPPNRAQWQANMKRVTDDLDDFIVSLNEPTIDFRKYPDLSENGIYTDAVNFNAVGIRRLASYVSKWFQKCEPGGKCVTLRSL